jgi:predicted DCC family thiol-disulfide oxidoreductase YuxK
MAMLYQPLSMKPVEISGVADGTIVFDGVCVLCSWWVQFVIERDAASRFRFVPIGSPYGKLLAARFGIDPENPQTNIVVTGNRACFKSDAAIRVLAALPHWSWVRGFALVPRPLRDWLYDHVARSRYRVFGRMEHCLVPTPALADRFVTEIPERRAS